MKIAISATGTDLDATIDERFGRCHRFILIETDDLHYEVLENHNADLSTGAGIQTAGLVIDSGAKVVITGNCGPKAMQVFETARIPVILGQRGVIRDTIDRVKREGPAILSARQDAGTATPTQPALDRRSGYSDGPRSIGRCGGRGMGGGGGRGMGGGGGRGMGGRCGGSFMGVSPGMQSPGGRLSQNEEMENLRLQAGELQQQMDAIQSRIDALGGEKTR